MREGESGLHFTIHHAMCCGCSDGENGVSKEDALILLLKHLYTVLTHASFVQYYVSIIIPITLILRHLKLKSAELSMAVLQ